MEELPQEPHALQLPVGQEELLLPGRALVDVEAGEDSLLHQLAIEMNLAVPGPLELLEDDLVHARPGVDQRGRDDRERAPLLDVPRGAEEALRLVEGVRVHAPREDLSARRDDGV